MSKFLFCLCLILSANILRGQTYTVPGAQQQPAWVFPLWFEDGNGGRDTLYFSYDSKADVLGDTVFGSTPEIIDTSTFQAYYSCSITSNLLAKKKITLAWPQLQVSICFLNTKMPLVLRWDENLFYSDSLPFADQYPAPRAQGILFFDLPMQIDFCSFELPLLMTDTVKYGFDTICSFTDSVQFTGTNASYLDFHVDPWTGFVVSVNNITSSNSNFKVFYDISSSTLIVWNYSNEGVGCDLVSTIGESEKLIKMLPAFSSVSCSLQSKPSGLYLISIKTRTQNIFCKIIKP